MLNVQLEGTEASCDASGVTELETHLSSWHFTLNITYLTLPNQTLCLRRSFTTLRANKIEA